MLKIISAILLLYVAACGSIGATPDASVEGIPSDTPAGAALKKNSGKFESCGRDSISVQTGSTQKLKIKFDLNNEGRARNIQISGMAGPDPDLHYCLVQALRGITFPKPKSAAESVEFPLTLKAL